MFTVFFLLLSGLLLLFLGAALTADFKFSRGKAGEVLELLRANLHILGLLALVAGFFLFIKTAIYLFADVRWLFVVSAMLMLLISGTALLAPQFRRSSLPFFQRFAPLAEAIDEFFAVSKKGKVFSAACLVSATVILLAAFFLNYK